MPEHGRRRLLLCQIRFVDIAGSEMVVLELIESFIERGWRVDLFTTVFGGPMAAEVSGHLASGRLQVLLHDSVAEADAVADPVPGPRAEHYDLIWVNHSLIPRSILAPLQTGPIMTPIVWHHMSSVLPVEMPLLYDVENALSSVITCVSPLARDRIADYGFSTHRLELFDNPAPDRFVEFEGRGAAASLSSLLIVSNHPPRELLEATRLLSARGIRVALAGAGGEYSRLTPAAIDAVDAVVTIGKTTQYALVMGVPVYSYDHVGGGGWITEENCEREHYANFSGRVDERMLTAEQIVDEIVAGYERARDFALAHRAAAAQRWSLTRQLDELLADERLRPRPRTLTAAAVQQALLLCAQRDELWTALRDAQRTAAQLAERLETVVSARSWRWTAPLRWARSLMPHRPS